jgi:hypothetical protein
MLFLSFRTGNECFPPLQECFTVQHDQAAAGVAANPDICTCPQDCPFISAAWMGFAGADNIAGKYHFNHNCISTFQIDSGIRNSGDPIISRADRKKEAER